MPTKRELANKFLELQDQATRLADALAAVRREAESRAAAARAEAAQLEERIAPLSHQVISLRTAISVTLDELDRDHPVPAGEAPLRR